MNAKSQLQFISLSSPTWSFLDQYDLIQILDDPHPPLKLVSNDLQKNMTNYVCHTTHHQTKLINQLRF